MPRSLTCLRIDVTVTRGLHLEHESKLLAGVTLTSSSFFLPHVESVHRITTADVQWSTGLPLGGATIDLLSSADNDAFCSSRWTLFGTSTAWHFVSSWKRTLVSCVTVEQLRIRPHSPTCRHARHASQTSHVIGFRLLTLVKMTMRSLLRKLSIFNL